MNCNVDINLEYDYLRVVYEIIIANLRVNKKMIEKEINTIILKYENLKKKLETNQNEVLPILRKLIEKTEELQKKFEEIDKKENTLYEEFTKRSNQLKIIDQDFNFENLKVFCEKKIDNLLLDYFLREKYFETAKKFINEEKLNDSLEYTAYLEMQSIMHSLKNKELNEALKWTQINKNKLSKINSDLKLKIVIQIFIEKYKKGEIKECVAFARENFKEFLDKHINEISKVMFLLALKPEKVKKLKEYKELLSEERWLNLEANFLSTFFEIFSLNYSSFLEILFQSGLISLKTSFCYTNNKCLSCPICSEEIGKVALNLPTSNHQISTLICRITGEIMDTSNPPLALPNGQVYSTKAINAQINANGKFVCPVTNEEYTIEQCKKVFIS
jgi:macrophage erythroblast attacher